MVLAAHAVAGAAVASLVPSHPAIGFSLAFASHFLLDAIPHWHYPLRSLSSDVADPMKADMVIGRAFVRDFFAIAADGLIGLCASLILFASQDTSFIVPALVGVFGGVLPDALQFAYMKWRHEPLIIIQRFHQWIHTDTYLDDQHILGPSYQVVICVMFVIAERVIVSL